MSGTGPVEAGEGTHTWDILEPEAAPESVRGRLSQSYARHRRSVIAAATAVGLAAGGSYLYVTRPEPAPPVTPFPSQVVTLTYAGEERRAERAPGVAFAFTAELTVEAGPPVTVERITQPSAALSVTSDPRTPFRTRASFPHRVAIAIHMSECGKVPRCVDLPFLDVTLRKRAQYSRTVSSLASDMPRASPQPFKTPAATIPRHHQNHQAAPPPPRIFLRVLGIQTR
jgi:hypothetical protein